MKHPIQSGRARGSLSSLAWRRFVKNPTAMAGLLWILLAACMAIAGYLITPDASPFANHQQLEIATEPPGFSIDMLHIRKNVPTRETSLFARMISGEPFPYTTIPVQSFEMVNDSLWFETWSGAPG
ncbi:MAG: hypothetical protein R6U86_03445, partial [Bacteroidales bacterium]